MERGEYAKVVCDSITEWGDRLTTFEVRYCRFVLAEFNTHRTFSRNSESSRAVPFPKKLARVQELPAGPVVWSGEQKGMQGGDEIDEPALAELEWLEARDSAIAHAQRLAEMGVHKSIVNRILEPFMWHTVVVSSTAWENFFRQRVSGLAQPEIRLPAELMLDAYKNSQPRLLQPGEWHLPYVEDEDWGSLAKLLGDSHLGKSMYPEMVRISSARCARVSYLTQAGKRDLQEDLNLWTRLTSASPMHASPLEHPATPAQWNRQELGFYPNPITDEWEPIEVDLATQILTLPKVGNFLGWQQHRLAVELSAGWQSFS